MPVTYSHIYMPPLVVQGAGSEQWALDISSEGFIITLRRDNSNEEWHQEYAMPPKLAQHLDNFMVQNYVLLNTTYGIATSVNREAS